MRKTLIRSNSWRWMWIPFTSVRILKIIHSFSRVDLNLETWLLQQKSMKLNIICCYKTMSIREVIRSGISSAPRITNPVKYVSTCSTYANLIVFTMRVWKFLSTQRRWLLTKILDGIGVVQKLAITRTEFEKMKRRLRTEYSDHTSPIPSLTTSSTKTTPYTLHIVTHTHTLTWRTILTRSCPIQSKLNSRLERLFAKPWLAIPWKY